MPACEVNTKYPISLLSRAEDENMSFYIDFYVALYLDYLIFKDSPILQPKIPPSTPKQEEKKKKKKWIDLIRDGLDVPVAGDSRSHLGARLSFFSIPSACK